MTQEVSHYLDEKLILFLEGTDRDAVLQDLVDLLDKEEKLVDPHEFHTAIMEREGIVSTGIGMGVAVPHARLARYDKFFIAMAILNEGVEWNALDGAPVRVVFMIGGPDDKQTEYLQILSSLTLAIRDEEKRKKILQQNDPKDIISLFETS